MTDDVRLHHWHERGDPPSSDHVDMDTLERHAAGDLSPAEARMVNDHLVACDDGRCSEYLRSLGGPHGFVGSAQPHERSPHGFVGSAQPHESPAGWGEEKAPPQPARSSEPSRSRTFQSREIIWSTFESLSRELDVPIDELVNEAMAAYARVRGYGDVKPQRRRRSRPAPEGRDSFEETRDAPLNALDRPHAPPRAGYDDDLALTAGRGPQGSVGSAPSRERGAGRNARSDDNTESRTAPRRKPAALQRALAAPLPPLAPPGGPRAGGPPPLPPRTMPPAAAPLASSRDGQAAKRLLITYRGHLYEVDKERFLIGRSKTQADLRLDDPNVSRQHAVVERVGSAWYIVDLGSTNGVHVAGDRVARRALTEGDVIVITSHELHCTFR